MSPEPSVPTHITIPWCESVWWREDVTSRALSHTDQVIAKSFCEDGYVVIDLADPAFDARAEQLRQELEPPLSTAGRLHDAWRTHPAAGELAAHPEILRILRLLYGREPIPFQTIHFRKGSGQNTHSDTLHFHTHPHRWMCGAWIALEDTDADNGPLHVYPGSHRWPVWDLQQFGIPPGPDASRWYEQALARWIAEQGLSKRVVTVKRGQAVLWAANLLHGGEPIRDPARTRWSQVAHYVFADTLAYVPVRSDLSRGQLFLREITDVRTGRRVVPVLDGRPVRPNAEQQFWMRPGVGAFLRAVTERAMVSLRRGMRK